jgi:cation diffusion facilitator CzcD-associated flavoprotein CzcO
VTNPTDRYAPEGTPTVVVVGAGFGGIAAGVKLKKARIHTFTIVESSMGIGGVWWDNRYPGCEVDVASHLYSYSFTRNDWTRTHARRDELQKYLEGVVDQFGLRSHLRLGTTVEEARWEDATHTWQIRLDTGETLTAHILISAVGFLNHPNYPDWPGLEDFAGPKFHTARWESEHDLEGKRIAIVGTGSTACQATPELAEVAEKLYVFQRDPGWISAKPDRDFSPEERARLRKPLEHWRLRLRALWLIEKGEWLGALYRPGSKTNDAREAACRAYIEEQFADRPDLKAAVTPSYHYPGKRPIFASGFYPALKRDNVELVPRAVASVTEKGIVDVDGVERQIDVLIMATGFRAWEYLPRLPVVGRGGRTLREAWAGEPQAFLGITVPGFPNFFMLYGPNTNGGEIVSNLERQSEYAVRVAKRLQREGVTSVEVKRSWCDAYNNWLQKHMRNTSWTETHTYFVSASGRIVTQWPYGATLYGAMTKLFGRLSETARTLDSAR